MEDKKRIIVAVKGSAKSGNYGHAGRRGKVGGSTPKAAPVSDVAQPVQPSPVSSRFAGKTKDELETMRTMYLDMIETRRAQRQSIPDAWRSGLSEVEGLLRGETVKPGTVSSLQVFGHPQATNINPGKYGNLIPIKIEPGDTASIDRHITRAQSLLDEVQTKVAKADLAARTKNGNATLKKYHSSANYVEDITIRDLLRDETIPELSRMRRLAEASKT